MSARLDVNRSEQERQRRLFCSELPPPTMPRLQRLAYVLRTVSRPAAASAGPAPKAVRLAQPSLASRLAPVASTSSAVFQRHLASHKLSSLFTTSLLASSSSPFATRLSLPSASPVLQQVRTAVYGNEYQPSQRVRKRRHGFLARRRSRNGRKILIRRRMKGRRFLTH